MSKRSVKSYSTMEEWNRTFFPIYALRTRLANFEGDPAVLAVILADEALRHAASQLTGAKKTNRTANLHK